MKKLPFKTILQVFIILLLSLFAARVYLEKGMSHLPTGAEAAIDIVDDSGYRIRMDKPAEKIISLYSAHTENLFALGLENEIIGVGTSESYPHAALEKEVFDYREDPEKIIAARPDLVVIRPFIERNNPNFVNAMKRAGLQVVSLYPENAGEFDDYILRLGEVTGRSKKAEQLLEKYHNEMDELEALTADFDERIGVYFESSDRGYKTITAESMAARAIEIAGGQNVATDALPIEEGSSIAAYGLERIIEKGSEIDVFVTQRGVMGAGGNYHSISIRPGFDTVKAVKEEKVFEINQKIISSPTFRQTVGIVELMRYFYPETFNDYEMYRTDQVMTRRDFANLSVRYMQVPIFVPTSSYFDSDYRGHKFGFFEDIDEDDEDYYYVETAVIMGYLEGRKDEEYLEFFDPREAFTKEELAQFIYLIGDYKNTDGDIEILDLDALDNARIVQTIVDLGIMDLEDGYFNPRASMTGIQVLEILEQL